jgi:hypothetical protein
MAFCFASDLFFDPPNLQQNFGFFQFDFFHKPNICSGVWMRIGLKAITRLVRLILSIRRAFANVSCSKLPQHPID